MSDRTRFFQGKWITDGNFADLVPVNVFHRQLDKKEILSTAPQNAHVLFRRRFAAGGGPATIYISADDYYKLYINGKFVCQGPAPGYPFHYYYNKVDITDYLTEGENLIAVHTYYQGLINRVWVSGDDRHGLILDVEQGGKVILSSDESFLCARHSGFSEVGKAGYATQFLEKYTSGSAQEGFEKPGYDDSGWEAAQLRRVTDYELFEQPSKMLVFEEIEPVSEEWDESGVTLDFGATYVGYLQARARMAGDVVQGSTCACGAASDPAAFGDDAPAVIEMLFGQERNDDGSVRWNLRCNCDYRELWQLSGGQEPGAGQPGADRPDAAGQQDAWDTLNQRSEERRVGKEC